MKVIMSADFTDEQFKFFAIRNGWLEGDTETYVDFAKRVALEHMKEFLSTPLHDELTNQLREQMDAQVEIEVKKIKDKVKLGV